MNCDLRDAAGGGGERRRHPGRRVPSPTTGSAASPSSCWSRRDPAYPTCRSVPGCGAPPRRHAVRDDRRAWTNPGSLTVRTCRTPSAAPRTSASFALRAAASTCRPKSRIRRARPARLIFFMGAPTAARMPADGVALGSVERQRRAALVAQEDARLAHREGGAESQPGRRRRDSAASRTSDARSSRSPRWTAAARAGAETRADSSASSGSTRRTRVRCSVAGCRPHQRQQLQRPFGRAGERRSGERRRRRR